MKYQKLFLIPVLALTSMLSSCIGDSNGSSKSTTISNNLALVMTSDYQTGALRWIATDSTTDSLSSASLSFNQDSKLVTIGADLYILERSGADNLVRIKTSALPAASAVQYQVSLGNGANPSDLVIFDATTGWLALTGRDYLLRFNPTTGSAIDSIDLSAYNYSDSTSNPSTVALALYGDTLCVVMQRLNSWSPSAKGLVALLNAKTGAILDTISLKGNNPQAAILDGARLLIPNEGDLMDSTTAASTRSLDVIDLKTGTVSVLATSTALGGAPGTVALDSKNRKLYVGVYHNWGTMPVAIIDADNGDILQTSIEGVADAEGGMAFDTVSGSVFIGDRSSTNGGLKIWNGTSLRTAPSGDALPPLSIAIANW